ncbi:hypothetical protein R6H99_18580, partial [Escherichia coli]
SDILLLTICAVISGAE